MKQKPMATSPAAGNFQGKGMDVRKISTPSPSPKKMTMSHKGTCNRGK